MQLRVHGNTTLVGFIPSAQFANKNLKYLPGLMYTFEIKFVLHCSYRLTITFDIRINLDI